MIVVDATVLVSLFRGTITPQVDVLANIEHDSLPFLIPTICSQEVLQGARSEKERKLMYDYLSTQQTLSPADPFATNTEAARIFFDCRRKGITIRSTVDCLVAQMVLDGDHVLLHDDRDYERICKVRPLRTHPIPS